ncbi:MAG: PBSX family phage terminase large subunit [Nitrospirae bacterium]|nr:PBSX family phage terminase large subunit [Nitrospirota bacterium]
MRNREKIKIQTTPIFWKNEQAKTQIVVNRGGAGSSKSFSLAQLIIGKFVNEKEKKILVVRKSLPSLKLSVLMLFRDLFDKFKLMPYLKQERVMLNYFYKQNILHFGSVDDPEKLKSTEWNYIWMEEATEFTYNDFVMLKLRLRSPSKDGKTNQMFLSFNPTDEFHWIKEKVLNATEDATEICSTYRDNPFIHPEYKTTLENLVNQDPNYYRIFALGEWGRLEHIIFSNWIAVDELPEGGDVFYGLDFGYNNPTSMVKLIKHDRTIYAEELLYQSGLTNSQLIERLKDLITNRRSPVYADEAEPARIEEIFKAGFNVHPADKSVKDGIDFVKRYKLHIHKASANMLKEIRAYSYRTDKNGNILEEPVKFQDHLMDATRYGLYTHLREGVEPRIRSL